jgi:hypothetical protein
MPLISRSPRLLPYHGAAEVTRKNAGVIEEKKKQEKEPPPFTKPKIGGAKEILQQNS